MSPRKDPDRTRQKLLEAAFETFHKQGFSATSLDDVLKTADVTKGALYHHFKSKADLGYAVVDEVIRSRIDEYWVRPLAVDGDPIALIKSRFEGSCESVTPSSLGLGCPLNNVAQELSGVDDGFRQRIGAVYRLWQDGLAGALRRGQKAGFVRKEVDADGVASFVMATMEGIAGVAKNNRDVDIYQTNIRMLIGYLESLRSTPENQQKSQNRRSKRAA